jgi:uncharacterized protein (TIGR02598 family)
MKKRLDRRGFSLVEVTLAIGIASFCLISIFALLSSGLTANRDSSNQTIAADLATSLAADLRAAPPADSVAGVDVTPFYGISLDGTTGKLYLNEDGSTNAAPVATAGAVFRTSVTVTPPPANSRAASTAWIRITWAASTDPSKMTPAGSYETVVSLNRN